MAMAVPALKVGDRCNYFDGEVRKLCVFLGASGRNFTFATPAADEFFEVDVGRTHTWVQKCKGVQKSKRKKRTEKDELAVADELAAYAAEIAGAELVQKSKRKKRTEKDELAVADELAAYAAEIAGADLQEVFFLHQLGNPDDWVQESVKESVKAMAGY
jgi:hypothetical protein